MAGGRRARARLTFASLCLAWARPPQIPAEKCGVVLVPSPAAQALLLLWLPPTHQLLGGFPRKMAAWPRSGRPGPPHRSWALGAGCPDAWRAGRQLRGGVVTPLLAGVTTAALPPQRQTHREFLPPGTGGRRGACLSRAVRDLVRPPLPSALGRLPVPRHLDRGL